MSERKLASVRTINDVRPIEGADRIEVVSVDGWDVVCQKGKHSVGEKVVFMEVDSFLPEKPEFEFLRKSCFKQTSNLGNGFRLRTKKLKGVVSQGLVMSLEELGVDPATPLGWDLTEAIGVQKWEMPIPANLRGEIHGYFPGFLPKTDQERCVHEDVKVLTENGPLKIKDICDNELKINVWSFNHQTEELELKPVTSYSIQSQSDDWYEIKLETGESITLTGNHLVWLPDLESYRRVDQIEVGDFFLLKD